MDKIICEICGAPYPSDSTNCPICGWAQRTAAVQSAVEEDLDFDFLNEGSQGTVSTSASFHEPVKAAPAQNAAPVQKTAPAAKEAPARKPREVFDYDAVNTKAARRPKVQIPEPVEDEEEELEENAEEEGSRPNVFLVILLVILIVALLLASGFIYWRYYLPSRGDKGAAPTETTVQTEATQQTEEVTTAEIPCTGLSLVSGMETLRSQGQFWLLHIKAVPEDTTDEIQFYSEDESVVTVNEEGRVTAVAEGETRIVITCGDQRIECPAVVDYSPAEATVAVTEPAETETTAATEATEAENPDVEPTEAATAPKPASNVVLKLKRNDITFGRRYVYVTLELDCDLRPEDVEWRTLNSSVATVKDGDVTAMGPGITTVIAKYGDQQVECIVRCKF